MCGDSKIPSERRRSSEVIRKMRWRLSIYVSATSMRMAWLRKALCTVGELKTEKWKQTTYWRRNPLLYQTEEQFLTFQQEITISWSKEISSNKLPILQLRLRFSAAMMKSTAFLSPHIVRLASPAIAISTAKDSQFKADFCRSPKRLRETSWIVSTPKWISMIVKAISFRKAQWVETSTKWRRTMMLLS